MTGRRLSKPLALCVALMTMVALVVPLTGVAFANHGARTLEVEPETDINPAGTTHTLTATLSAPADTASGPIEVDFEIESGPATRTNCQGDADPATDDECTGGTANNDGNTPTSPDMTCTVEVGSSTCQVSFTSEDTGTNVIRAWIDHDKSNATVEADRNEGRISDECSDDEVPADQQDADCDLPVRPVDDSEPGDDPEPDDTDVVEKTWVANDAAILDCEPETATNPSTGEGSAERYVCTVTDEFGNPIKGAHVDGENLNGANDPDSSPGNPNSTGSGIPDYDHQTAEGGHFCTTDANGQCSDTVEAIDGESGTALICFFASETAHGTYNTASADQGEGGDCDTESRDHTDNDMTDVVQKTWEARRAQGVDAEPETDTNNTGDNHTITATVYDQFGAEFSESGTTVNFEFFAGSPGDTDGNSDTSNPDRTCTTTDSSTDSDSSCSITYTATTEGRDTVCVYVGSPPSADPGSRSCGGEGLNESQDDPKNADAPASGSNQGVDVVEKNWVEPQPGLDCEPEQSTNPQRSEHTITCTALNAEGNGEEGTRIHAEAQGANDPDNGYSPQTPDFECTTPADDPLTPLKDESETCSFTHGDNEDTSQPGITTYTIWIDEDNNASTFDGDAGEGPNAGAPNNPNEDEEGATGTRDPGDDPEPDNTDVVQKEWVPAPDTLTMEPENDQAKVGTCNPYTITVLDENGQPARGAVIDVEQRHERSGSDPSGDEPRVLFCTPTAQQGANPSGVNTEEGDLSPPEESPDDPGTLGGETTRTTDQNGKITIGIAVQPANGSDGSGNVTITAFYDEGTDNDDPDSGEPQDTSTKTWIAPEGRNILCSPRQASNPTGTTHTVTCTVTDQDGAPAEDETVVFSESGPGEFTSPTQAETDQNGRVTATTTSDQAGEQSITATLASDTGSNEPDDVDECDRAENDPQGAPEGNCSDTVSKTWVEDQQPQQCEDNADNDNDDLVDEDDPGCRDANGNYNPNDDDETDEAVQRRGACAGFARGSTTPKPDGSGSVIVGTPDDDILVGTGGDDTICGLGGNDQIDAGAGRDQVVGNAGNDQISGDGGRDQLSGGGGRDTVVGRGGNDVLNGGRGKDTLKGNAGIDTIAGQGGEDTLQGGNGEDTLDGGGDDDVLRGWNDNDTLLGRRGNDVLHGGRGRDVCRPGPGRDTVRACERR